MTCACASANDQADSELDSLLRKVAHVDQVARGPVLPQQGQVLGDKYRVESQLGRGGMGAVFQATHVLSQKPVALKWMLRSPADERARARFLREARAAGRVDHPNVVDVYDIGQDGSAYYLVMELLRGETLRARIAGGPLSVPEALELLLPAMHGVAAVHRAGVIHRDLKPDNIFLCQSPDGSPREAKVLDFGISAVCVDAHEQTLTEDGAILGTPAYMSPEQLHSQRDLDVRSDVYAFGVILYEALTGRLPIAAGSYAAMVLAAADQVPIPLRELRPDVPAALERVVLRALSKRREDRHATMDELIGELSAVAERLNASGMAREPAPASRLAWLAGLAVASALLGFAHWFEKDLHPARARAEQVHLAVPAPVDAPPILQSIVPVVTLTATVPAEPIAPKRERPMNAPARPAIAPRHVSKAPTVPTNPATPPDCDLPYSVDAAGRILFKPECI